MQKAGKLCSGCNCNGCKNQESQAQIESNPNGKRKRTKTSRMFLSKNRPKTPRLSGHEHLSREGIKFQEPRWTSNETFLLSEIIRKTNDPSVLQCMRKYNFIIRRHPELGNQKTKCTKKKYYKYCHNKP